MTSGKCPRGQGILLPSICPVPRVARRIYVSEGFVSPPRIVNELDHGKLK